MKIDIEYFIKKHVTKRDQSLLSNDLKSFDSVLKEKINFKSVLVIGGAGTIGSNYIKAILKFNFGVTVQSKYPIHLNNPWWELNDFEIVPGVLNCKNPLERSKSNDVFKCIWAILYAFCSNSVKLSTYIFANSLSLIILY